MLNRMIGVVSFNAKTYREVASDSTANTQTALIVLFVSSLAGFIFALVVPLGWGGIATAIIFAIASTLVALGAWIIGAMIATFIATALFGGKIKFGEIIRITGYVTVFELLSVVPIPGLVGWILSIAGWILMIVASAIGIQQIVAFGFRRAITIAVVVGAIRYMAMLFLPYRVFEGLVSILILILYLAK
jgi:hypothetical protein